MSLRLIKQLETAAARLAKTPEFCEHTFAEIIFPDNQKQTFSPCFRCAKPRLIAVLNFEDGRLTERWLEKARAALAESAETYPTEPEEKRRAAIARAFRIDARLL